jgi:hypothetical protein
MNRTARGLRKMLTGLIEGTCLTGCIASGVSAIEVRRSMREVRLDAYARDGVREIDAYLSRPVAGVERRDSL